MRKVEHLQNMLERSRREFARKYCLHPDAPSGCSDCIVAAHSVQRAMLENYIGQNGHVVQIKVTAHVDPVGLLAKPDKVGLNKATTFSGFCSKHDSDLFRPLESASFDFEWRQIALLGYRSVCRELYLKDAEIAAADALRNYASVNPDIPGFAEKDERHHILRLARINARTNLANAKDRYASMLSDGKPLKYYAIKFADRPVYFNSVAFLPEWDFEGGRLQDLSFITEYKPICFSAWAADDRAAAVFCWHDSADDVCVPFVDSLRRCKKDRLADRIMSMAFEVSDNVVFGETWWESISEPDRQRLVNRTFSGVGDVDRTPDCLADDGLRALASAVEKEYVQYRSREEKWDL
jgi:hypothetical protein